MDLDQTNEPRFTDEEMAEVDRLQSDPTSEYYYNDPDESFLDKVMRKLEPYGEDFKGFIEYLFTPSRHFGTGQYSEGGLEAQMSTSGLDAEGRRRRTDSSGKYKQRVEEGQEDIAKAASFLVPFYDSGVNISNVVQEYMKPEQERDYDYIKNQFTEAGQSAAIEAGLLLMGGVAAKYGGKGIKALADKVKQIEVKTNPNTVSMLGMGSVTISKKPAIDRAADVKEAERLIDDPDALRAWIEKEGGKGKRQENPADSEAAAQALIEGSITSKEARKRIGDAIPPPKEYTADEVRNMMPTVTDVTGAMGKKARDYGILGVKGFDLKLKKGQLIGTRLDIPAYNKYDKWVVSIHDGGTKEKINLKGSVLGYGQAIRLKNVRFGSDATTALDIARGKRTDRKTLQDAIDKKTGGPAKQDKATIARAVGEYVPQDPYELQEMAASIIESGSKEWTQVGMNPYRGSQFYDKKTGKIIFDADEMIQVGPLVLAKNAKVATISDLKEMAVRTKDGKLRMFSEGGTAMNEQMEMAFMQEGGIKDDGMTKDPVSGNPIPPGSMANEVRDDIPAMLSEGEYVVPADVLRFYGVNFFEGLRNKAKTGLQNMEKNGRIGGEPLSQQQIQQNMGQSGVTMQANQGGAVGYNPGGLQNQLDPYLEQAKNLGGGADLSQYGVVGGSAFSSSSESNSITRSETFEHAETGATRSVQFVSSGKETKVVPKSDEQYTKPPYYLQGSAALKQAQEAFQQSQTGGGSDPKDPPEPKPKQPFGIDVDWTNPKAYADSLLEGPDGLPKSIQMFSALAGPFGMAAVGGANAAMTLGKISDLRATQIIAQAQGDTTTSDYIEKQLGELIKRSPNIVSFLEEAVAPGTSKAKEVLDRLGLDYEEDKKGNITFTERMQELNNRRITASQFDKDKSGGVYKPGGIDVALGQGSSSDKDYNAAVAKSRAAAAARRAAMEEAQAAGGSSDDIADLREKYEEAGGTWASGGRAEGGLMTKAKKKK